MADHQVAHVYVNGPADAAFLAEVRAVLEQVPGVEAVLDHEAQSARGILHVRSGDFLAVAAPNAWFCYYYWDDDRHAPDFARTVDIHRKPGYDPAELFIDPSLRFPRLHAAKFLAKKKLGLRALLELTPLDATLVRGSHGRVPEDEEDHPVLIIGKDGGSSPAAFATREFPSKMEAQDVFGFILRVLGCSGIALQIL